MTIHHKVRVFVFNWEEGRIRYLLLKKAPSTEHTWGPVAGPVNLGEHLQEAAVREVREETGILRPVHLIDLEHTQRLVFGDEGLVEWEFGYQAPGPTRALELAPSPEIVEFHWLDFDQAYDRLETPEDRTGIVRLRMRLQAG